MNVVVALGGNVGGTDVVDGRFLLIAFCRNRFPMVVDEWVLNLRVYSRSTV